MHRHIGWTFALMVAAISPALAEDISGTWSIDGQVTPICAFTQTDNNLTGSCKGPSSSGSLTGTVAGQNVQWTYTWIGQPQRTRGVFEFTGTVDANRMSGKVLINGKSQSFTARKTSR
jgi:hypothetical protein